MKKPVIAVMPLYDEQKESIWMLPGYMDALAQAGAIPLMLPRRLTAQEAEQTDGIIDGYLFTGGHDISPIRYGEKALPCCGAEERDRDELEFSLFRLAYAQDKPIFGICRGFQLINAALGGTLWQDIPSQMGSGIRHMQAKPYDRGTHEVIIERQSRLFDIVGEERLIVNSCHHQGIRTLAPVLRAEAKAPDGLAEAVCDDGRSFVMGVQWHPEFLYKNDEPSKRLFKAFSAACSRKQ